MSVFSHIAGDRFVDLLNTGGRLRDGRPDEDLTTFDAVVTWCAESDVVSSREAALLREQAARAPRRAARERGAVITMREAAYRALVLGSVQDAATVAALYRTSVSRSDLVPAASGWTWRERELDLTTPRDRIARGLFDVFGRDDLDRLHVCEDAVCGWVFLDTSPRRNRRWCAAADCGDRNRARAYYARQRDKRPDAAPPPPPPAGRRRRG